MKYAPSFYLLSATAALAHPGHPEAEIEGPAHWLTHADHLIVLALAAALAGVVLRRWASGRRKGSQKVRRADDA